MNRSLTLALATSCVLGIAVTRPATAQNLFYTLQGVTFGDNATATGYFDYNPTTQVFGDYDITTSAGVTDRFPSSRYTPATGFAINSFYFFDASGVANSPTQELILSVFPYATAPGTYSLLIPTTVLPSYLDGSGEFASSAPTNPGARGVTSGYLIVTNANPVPEASTTVSFGLLLALGLGGVAIAARKKKVSA